MQPDHVGHPGVDRHEVLDLVGGIAAGGDRRRVELGGEVVGRLVAAENLPPPGRNGVVVEVIVPEIDVGLPDPGEGVRVVGEARAEEVVPAGETAVVDEDEVRAGGGAVVGERVHGRDLDGGDDGGIGGERVEADVGGGRGGGGEDEVGVCPVARCRLGPRGAEGEDERGGGGDVEGRGAELGVVVVVDGEEAEVVAAGREREGVAAGLARRRWREEAERALLRLREPVRLRDHARLPPGGEELVGEPPSAEHRDEIRRAAAVDVVAVVPRRWRRNTKPKPNPSPLLPSQAQFQQTIPTDPSELTAGEEGVVGGGGAREADGRRDEQRQQQELHWRFGGEFRGGLGEIDLCCELRRWRCSGRGEEEGDEREKVPR